MLYYYIYIPLIAFFLNIFLALLVLRSNFKSFINRISALFLLFMALWGLFIFGMRSSTDIGSAMWWDRLSLAFAPLMSLFFLHLILEISHKKLARWALRSIYIVTIVLAVLSFTPLLVLDMKLEPLGYTPVYGILSCFIFPWIFLLVILSKLCEGHHPFGFFVAFNLFI